MTHPFLRICALVHCSHLLRSPPLEEWHEEWHANSWREAVPNSASKSTCNELPSWLHAVSSSPKFLKQFTNSFPWRQFLTYAEDISKRSDRRAWVKSASGPVTFQRSTITPTSQHRGRGALPLTEPRLNMVGGLGYTKTNPQLRVDRISTSTAPTVILLHMLIHIRIPKQGSSGIFSTPQIPTSKVFSLNSYSLYRVEKKSQDEKVQKPWRRT